MSYGMTPYDKKSYKDSKRRRRQALAADKTGKILPYGSSKRKVVIIVCIVSLLIIIACAVITALSLLNNSNAQSTTKQQSENSEELLAVVNRQSPLTRDYVPQLADIDGIKVNVLAKDNLVQMLADAQSQDITLTITSGYVSFDEQQQKYEAALQSMLTNPDYTEVRAQAAVQKQTPQGGYSEAQTGLLVEFDTENDKAQTFLERNCINYGFVLRYPQDKEDVTSMNGNKSLYRYVGAQNAVKMRSFGMCLEEYSEYLSVQKNGN